VIILSLPRYLIKYHLYLNLDECLLKDVYLIYLLHKKVMISATIRF